MTDNVLALCKILSWLFNSERNLILMKPGRPQPIWAPATSLSSSPTLPLYPSVPSSGCFLYLEHSQACFLRAFEMTIPPGTRMAHCLTSFEPLLQCQLISEADLRILHKIAPFPSTTSFYPPYCFIFSKLLSPSDIYSFYTFSPSSSIESQLHKSWNFILFTSIAHYLVKRSTDTCWKLEWIKISLPPRSSGIHPRFTRLVLHSKIN